VFFFGDIQFVAIVTENNDGSNNHGNGKSWQLRDTHNGNEDSEKNDRKNTSVRDDNKSGATVTTTKTKAAEATTQSSVMTIKFGDSGNNKNHNTNNMESLTMAMKTMAIRQLQWQRSIDRCCVPKR
jgi:hypothetical protein